MITGLVTGEVTATVQHPFYDGKRLMMVDRIDDQGKPTGEQLIAIDSVGAGPGEQVLIIDEGNSARSIVKDSKAPLRSIIVGIIDHMETGNA